jgi:hypothetical protein
VWLILKSVAGRTLGCRTLLIAVLAAVVGGVVMAAVGLYLVRGALGALNLLPEYRGTILLIVGAIYGGAGAIASAQSVLLGAPARATQAVTVEHLPPIMDGVVGQVLARWAGTEQTMEIRRIDQVIDSTFDSVAGSTLLPLLGHAVRLAAKVGRWRCRRQLAPFLDPLRAAGQERVSIADLRKHLTRAACETIILAAINHIARTRLILWLICLVLLLIPAATWGYARFLQ